MADDSRPGRQTREDIERLVVIESELRSHEKQINSLRQTRQGQQDWLGKLELRSAATEQNLSKLSEEVRHMDITLEGLSSKQTEAIDSLRKAIADIKETLSVEKVKIALVMAGIGFATGIISSVATAIVLAKVIG